MTVKTGYGIPLSELIAAENVEGWVASAHAKNVTATNITGVQEDSRRVRQGDLFVAIKGLRADGHEFAQAAVNAGAVAIVAQHSIDLDPDGAVPVLIVDDPVRVLGQVSSRLQGNPSKQLDVIGITGTNGKTTTCFLLEAMLAAAGHRCGLIGTVAYRVAGDSKPAPYTTPTAIEIQDLLAQMQQSACSHAVMEVSSHGLQLGRLWGSEFSVAGFSHITQDHLDLHGTMEAYLKAKVLLFSRHLRPGGTAVVNLDGDGSEAVVAAVRARSDVTLLRCTSRAADGADVWLSDIECSMTGIRAMLHLNGQCVDISSPLVGRFNADNLLLAATCAHAMGIGIDPICSAIRAMPGVPGRLERVSETTDSFAVFVDYAHTPDALVRVLETVKPLCSGRLVVLFGCGGDRDRTKRPIMAEATNKLADLVIVTSDNPRSEDPQQIIAQIIPPLARDRAALSDPDSLRDATDHSFWVEPDRSVAIDKAVACLKPNDILIVAGKGHEDYQLVGDKRLHFDDREQVRLNISKYWR